MIERALSIAESVGFRGLSVMYPNEFEYYLVALELVSSQDLILDHIVFPVMPSSINRGVTRPTSVKKTFDSVTVTKNSGFTPISIRLAGTFGRSMKILIDSELVDLGAARFASRSGFFDIRAQQDNIFDETIKTGYGVCKMLESILEKANQPDDKGGVPKLILYNLSFNDRFIVEPISFDFSQDQSSSNAMWQYSLNLTAVAPANRSVKEMRSTTIKQMTVASIQSKLGNLIRRSVR